MAVQHKIRVAVLGASGYTGADLIRLAVRHRDIELVALAANTHAGKPLADVFPHLTGLDLPDLCTAEQINWSGIDAVFCGLPHGAADEIIAALPTHLKIIDMSADFRFDDADVYATWYGRSHGAPQLLADGIYGLTEHNRDAIAKARLVACPGCYPTATLLGLLPLVKAGLIESDDLIIDAKSGLSGAGRGLKQNTLFAEAGEGMSPYSIASHRHAPEIEQEISKAEGHAVTVNFTPHLVPMTRGELVTCYVRLAANSTVTDLRAAITSCYGDNGFVRLLGNGVMPATQHVRGSNYCHINIFQDRIPGRAIVIATLDNLVKGSAGQALQNFNVMHGLPQQRALEQVALFP